jgi:hypothetical protein
MPDGAQDRTRKLVRGAVLKTNPYPPFRVLNRLPYRWALRAVRKIARTIPEIRSIGVRNGFATGDWIPGLSDIDLLAIVSEDLDPGRGFAVVDSFRASYFQLQRTFPMLGELIMLAEDDLDAWLPAETFTPGKLPLATIHGVPIELPEEDSPRWRSRALELAMGFYLDRLPPCLVKPDSYLQRMDVLRRVKKIDRLLRPIRAEKGEKGAPIDPHAAVPVLVAHAAKLLETAVALVDCGAYLDKRDRSNPPEGVADVCCTLAHRNTVIVTLPNGLTTEAIAAITVGRRWGQPPLPLAESVFAYMVRRYDPYSYAELLRGREIAFGADPPEGVLPPGKAEFAAYLLSQFAYALAFTRGQELFPASESPFVAVLERELDHLMGIRFVVEEGWVTADWREVGARWRRVFPESAQALDEIKLVARHASRAARQQAFALFRSLANEVRAAVTAVETRV